MGDFEFILRVFTSDRVYPKHIRDQREQVGFWALAQNHL